MKVITVACLENGNWEIACANTNENERAIILTSLSLRMSYLKGILFETEDPTIKEEYENTKNLYIKLSDAWWKD